ncbi:MAG: DUF6680 family protein [Thermodesulfobacteriota bacterium]|nr:DUF6680 family protein [Thermodesulfobacteriota bacterium]
MSFFQNLSAESWVMVGAIIVGPILSIQIQKLLEKERDKKERRLQIFKTLMSTRADRLYIEHVRALNMIDIEFYGRKILNIKFQLPKEKSVTTAWNKYKDHLIRNSSETPNWKEVGDEYFTKLLYAMAQALGYDFDEVHLKRDIYKPSYHMQVQVKQHEVLSGLADILSNKRPFPVLALIDKLQHDNQSNTDDRSASDANSKALQDERHLE